MNKQIVTLHQFLNKLHFYTKPIKITGTCSK